MKKNLIFRWFKSKGWKPFPFQVQAWSAWLAGRSGMIHSPTGTGKTYAVWMPPLMEWLKERGLEQGKAALVERGEKPPPLRVLWITPLRALANDTVASLRIPLTELGIPWSVELRTGDTSAAARARQRVRFPTALVTTPESLSLLLSYPDTREKLASLRAVVVDEWHDLLSTKRGVQTELCLARIRSWFPKVRIWGLSATLGNLQEAMDVLVGDAREKTLISGDLKKRVEVKTLLPRDVQRFPWAGHVGLKLLPKVIRHLEKARTTLLFTNTRSQTEIWFRALLAARPDWKEEIALHHGSIDRDVRAKVEQRLRAGSIRCVVCTASLDLGVDFSPVEQVIQIGAPKGVARILQRAGRSGHQPGSVSRIICVPAHALELVEFAAVREAIAGGELESRHPIEKPLDVLIQHLVTLALGGGFDGKELLAEIRSAHAYRNLSDQEWQWCIDFVTQGGKTLKAYPQFCRVNKSERGYEVTDPFIARFHRMSVGTITSDGAMLVRLLKGGTLGTIEESFISRLRRGDRFSFAGHALELVRVREMTAYVRSARRSGGLIPQWMGGKMPLSSQLATSVRRKLAEARRGEYAGREMTAARPVLEIQNLWSRIPDPDELLIERIELKDGTHHFVFPFAGRLAHEGLAALAAHRVARLAPRSISVTLNDYGFGLLSSAPFSLTEAEWRDVFSTENLLADLLACLNSTELAKRQFREIARIAGLVFQGYPGSGKTTRQLQASSGLFYDVFVRYDPGNLLLDQARREVLERQLEISRLRKTLDDLDRMHLAQVGLRQLTPLAFPLWASFVQADVSSEKWGDRIKKMAVDLEMAAEAEMATA